jgi:NADPH2:quinone reductase
MVARRHGGPEVIAREEFDPGAPGPGELLIANAAIGLNFIDTYYRSGLYPAEPPVALGAESVGTVLAVGKGVTDFAVGDRAGCINGAGAYATHRVIAADKAVRIPDDVSSDDAAAIMLKGFTACYLAEDMWPLEPGQTVLVHSAAGGVGSILVPWLRDKGVRVIAHVGSAAKAATVAADHVFSGRFDTLAADVRRVTADAGVAVVFDGVGADSWTASLASVGRRGLLVSYGNASGAGPAVAPLELMRAGSIYLSRPTMADYTATRAELERTAERTFDRLRRGVIAAHIGQRFALGDAADAHRALEARQTTGSTILTP